MSRLCYEHDVCLSVCKVGVLWSHSATKSGNRHMTGQVGVLATYMPKPTRIVISCDPNFYTEDDQWGMEKCVEFWPSAAYNGLRVALYQHMLSFLFIVHWLSWRTTRTVWLKLYIHCTKNIRVFTDILWRVFHILTESVPYTFVSVNRRNNESRPRTSWFYRFTDTNVYGTRFR